MDKNRKESAFRSFSTNIMFVCEVFCKKNTGSFFDKINPLKDNSLLFSEFGAKNG